METPSLQVPTSDLFTLVCRSAGIGCWSVHLGAKECWFSRILCEWLGISNENNLQTFEYFLDHIVHPADRIVVTRSVKNFLYHHAASDKGELRLRTGSEYQWFEIAAEAHFDVDGTAEYLFGTLINIDEKKLREGELKKLKSTVDLIDEVAGTGTFEMDFTTGERRFSKAVYDILELPYDADPSRLRREDFYEANDVRRVERATAELKQSKKPYDLEIRVITAKKNTCWIRIVAKPVTDKKGKAIALRGTIQKIEKEKLKENFLIEIRDRIKEQKFFLDETSSMSDVGGWEMDMEQDTLFWSDQTKIIYGVDKNHVPSFDEAIAFYTPSSAEILLKHFSDVLETGKPYDLELELVTKQKDAIWVRVIGKPVFHLGKIIKVRGVIQNITKQKYRELELNNALNIINEQNDKLKDFTYIVSHNLRSHAGNLKMITEMVDLETDMAVKLEWLELIKSVSASLSQTVSNLNGLVTLNMENKRRLSFTEIYNTILQGLNYKIIDEEVEITTDFSACDTIEYVPAYLESIMLNLITNAIKYKHPERKAALYLQTGIENNRPLLRVKDNGLGINLEMYGSRLFKMNQTFHQNSDARGIGLYITKNQIEVMGGSIEVESEVDKGTTFIVHF